MYYALHLSLTPLIYPPCFKSLPWFLMELCSGQEMKHAQSHIRIDSVFSGVVKRTEPTVYFLNTKQISIHIICISKNLVLNESKMDWQTCACTKFTYRHLDLFIYFFIYFLFSSHNDKLQSLNSLYLIYFSSFLRFKNSVQIVHMFFFESM